MSTKFKALGGVVAGAFAVDKVLDFGAEMLNTGRFVEQANRRIDTVFGDSNREIRKWADDVNESLGLTDTQVANLASTVGDLLVPMGATRDEAAKLSADAVDLAGALAEWSNGAVDVEGATERITAAMLGETEGLKTLGIKLDAAMIAQEALKIATADGRTEATEMDKALAVLSLTTASASDAVTAFAENEDSLTRKQAELNAKWGEAKETLAEGLLPIMTEAATWLVDDFIPAAEDFAGVIRDDVLPVVVRFGEDVNTWIVEPLTTAVRWLDNFTEKAGGLAGIFESGGFAGVPLVGQLSQLTGRASGGPVNAGQTYVVGENGPELFRSSTSGTIVPNGALGGGAQRLELDLRLNGRDVQKVLLEADARGFRVA
jgi:hypothetical protein